MRGVATLFILALVLAGCGSAAPTLPVATATSEPTRAVAIPTSALPTSTMTPTPVPMLAPSPTATLSPTAASPRFADCGWFMNVGAWIDRDANGIRDPIAEPPLAGVMFNLVDTSSGVDYKYGRATTGADGTARLGVFLAGCPAIKFDVVASAPPGYRATTPLRVKSYLGALFEVGFVAEP